VTRWTTAALTALGAYGLTLAASGVALALAPVGPPATTVLLDDGTRPGPAGLQEPAATAPPSPPLDLAAPPLTPGPRASVPDARRATSAAGQRVPFVPTTIVLPSGHTAPVSPSGVLPDGSLVIPDRPDQVGWWDGGARAGDALGSLVIAGHVDSRTFGLGILAELKWVKAGSVIEVRAGSERQRYQVYQAVQVSQQSLATDDEFFRQDGPHRLVVITCGGPFDRSRHRYLDNYIVLARPIS
jgi:hypothetical protein